MCVCFDRGVCWITVVCVARTVKWRQLMLQCWWWTFVLVFYWRANWCCHSGSQSSSLWGLLNMTASCLPYNLPSWPVMTDIPYFHIYHILSPEICCNFILKGDLCNAVNVKYARHAQSALIWICRMREVGCLSLSIAHLPHLGCFSFILNTFV